MFEITLDEIYQINQRKIDSQMLFKKTLAKGAFGTVMLAYDQSKHKEVAVKIIQKDNERTSKTILSQFSEEINILKKTNHPNIVHLYDFFETKDKVYIVMEYIKGGTLAELMEQRCNCITDNEIRTIIKHLLKALDHLHKLGICHRDIKPDNIMFNSFDDFSSLKLIDFGLSTELATNSLRFCGTVLFMSPERLMKKKYTSAIDTWSIGIILYMLLHNGNHPFHINHESVQSYITTVKKTSIDSVMSPSVSFLARHLIKKLLEVKASNRYLAAYALHHPWLSQDYSTLKNHLNKEEIKEFKAKEVNALLAMVFLCKYGKDTHKSNEIEDDTKVNSQLMTSPNNATANTTIRKAKTNSYYRKGIICNEASALFKTKVITHLAIFSQLSPVKKQHSFKDNDSQSTKGHTSIKSETQSNMSSHKPIKCKVFKLKQTNNNNDIQKLTVSSSSPPKFLSTYFRNKNKNEEKAVTIPKYHPLPTEANSSSNLKTASLFHIKVLKSDRNQSINNKLFVLPLVKAKAKANPKLKLLYKEK